MSSDLISQVCNLLYGLDVVHDEGIINCTRAQLNLVIFYGDLGPPTICVWFLESASPRDVVSGMFGETTVGRIVQLVHTAKV
jgi:hypothetical protein